MIIPSRKLEDFVGQRIDECLASQSNRVNQYAMMTNYALTGSDNPQSAALFNKTYAYLDDLQSLLYSPVSLRYHIGNPELPSVLEEAKGRAAATRLRNAARKADADTRISEAIWWSLVKGKALIKSNWKRGSLCTNLVQPESFGVRHENHGTLDEDMEAFCHTMFISAEQFARIVWKHPDRDKLIRNARNYVQQEYPGQGPNANADKQVITGGLYPFQPAGSQNPNNSRGIVDWMGAPKANLAPQVTAGLLPYTELWVWDDEREDWRTFGIVGRDMLIVGKMQKINAFAVDPETHESVPDLKGRHPYNEFCVNPIDGYFWGRSEVLNVALLQEAINSRITGINRMLRKQEDPTMRITGTSVSQLALSRYKKPGGYYNDPSAAARIEPDKTDIPETLWASLTQYERMFDEMGGLPPTARGHGESGVRSQAHAETLIRMFSPRFKDRALLAERDVEAFGGLHLDMARAHDSKKMIAWVPPAAAGLEGEPPDKLLVPPIEGFVSVAFTYADIDEDATLTIDSHSSSPAFSQEALSLTFNMLKAGLMTPEDAIQRTDVSDPDELIASVERKQIAQAKATQQAEMLKLVTKGGGKR